MTLGPSSSAFVSFLSYQWLFNVATSFVNGPLPVESVVVVVVVVGVVEVEVVVEVVVGVVVVVEVVVVVVLVVVVAAVMVVVVVVVVAKINWIISIQMAELRMSNSNTGQQLEPARGPQQQQHPVLD